MIIPRSTIPIAVPGSRVKVAFAPGAIDHLGEIAKSEGANRILLVTDPGIRKAGHVERALRSLHNVGLIVRVFDGVKENPTTKHVGNGLLLARECKPDFIIGLGGGSSMDCAKGINFLYTNGGRMQEYWGVNKATKEMLPFIAIPTTAGTGSEAQSFALITDPETHQKMACGDVKASAKVAILDPELIATAPLQVAAATGIDAIAHAVETTASKKRNEVSRAFSVTAWNFLESAFGRSTTNHSDADARQSMLLGSHLAGCAIENSMLGAAHACANPLTAHFGIIHGVAVGLILPHVVRFNASNGENPYADLDPDAERLAQHLTALLHAGQLPHRLSDFGVAISAVEKLATDAAKQWTATFNPRQVGVEEFAVIYRNAL